MSEEHNPPSDLPSPKEKGEESYPSSKTNKGEKKTDEPEPTTLPSTRETQEGVYAG